jgi:hypothetical protein
MKYLPIDEEVIVITDCTEKTTVSEFVDKCAKFKDTLIPGKSWRVFFADNLPDPYVWKEEWDRRVDYLLDLTDGEKTLKDIGIGPKKYRLFYFMQYQFYTRHEP